jgi:hypothetical protein
MTIYDLALGLVIVVVALSIFATALITRTVVTGSYRRYVEKRNEHVEHMRRIDEELQRKRR